MNNYYNQRPIITVTGEDAKLVRIAEQIDIEASKRAQADAGGAIAPMIYYETEAERTVMNRLRELEKKYQMAYGLACLPILVAAPAPNLRPAFEAPVRRAREAPTDMELKQLLLERVHLRRVKETVYKFNGCIYQAMSKNELHTLIQDKLRDELNIDGSSRQLSSVAAAIIAEPSIEVNPDEMNAAGICLNNGILSLADFRLYEHSHKFFLTWKLDVDWLGEQPCPHCDQFFAYAAGGDPTLIQRFWEALAYALFPDYKAKRFILLMGKGDTGKSVYGAVVESFFEKDAVGSVDIFKFGDRFSIATLVHKCVNISMDLSNAALNEQATAMIKQITGGDLVQVEEKYKTPYAARIDCKLIFGTNHALRTNSQDVAFLRRILYLPFNNQVPHSMQNPNLRQILRAERSGIFYKALNAYIGLVSKGYFFSGDDIYDFTQAYQVGEDIADMISDLEQFVTVRCVEQQESFVPTDVLFECYQSYCQNLNHGFIQNKQTFSTKFNALIQRIPSVKLCKKRVNGTPSNGYAGIALM